MYFYNVKRALYFEYSYICLYLGSFQYVYVHVQYFYATSESLIFALGKFKYVFFLIKRKYGLGYFTNPHIHAELMIKSY